MKQITTNVNHLYELYVYMTYVYICLHIFESIPLGNKYNKVLFQDSQNILIQANSLDLHSLFNFERGSHITAHLKAINHKDGCDLNSVTPLKPSNKFSLDYFSNIETGHIG